jgi:hypothetical protein
MATCWNTRARRYSICVDRCRDRPPRGSLRLEGRTHRLSLEPDVLSVAADWMDRQRAVWGRLFDVVDEYLKEEAP